MHHYQRTLAIGIVASLAHGVMAASDEVMPRPQTAGPNVKERGVRDAAEFRVPKSRDEVTPQPQSDIAKALESGVIDAGMFRVPKAISYRGLPSTDRFSGWYVFPSDSRYENAGTVKKFFVDIYTIDKKLSSVAEQRPANLSALKYRTLIDARNAAASELGEGIKYSDVRFPADKQRQVEDMLTSIKVGLESPSARDQVKTRISYAGPGDVVLHYRTYAQSVEDAPSWSTYVSPQLMRMGTYQFRVSSTRGKARAQPCLESVAVINDPTEKSICGGYAP